MNWYPVSSKSREEDAAAVNLQNQGIEVYLPKSEKNGQVSPLFPGYLFARMSLEFGDWSVFDRTPKVRGLVKFGANLPLRIHESVINGIRARETDGLRRLQCDFQPGDKAVILETGIFFGYSGIVKKVKYGVVCLALPFENTKDQIFDFDFESLEKIVD